MYTWYMCEVYISGKISKSKRMSIFSLPPYMSILGTSVRTFIHAQQTIPKTTSSRDYFSTLATLIVGQAPAIHIPWLHATARQLRPTTTKHLEMESETERGGEREELLLKPHSQPQPDNVVARSQYFPVSIKKTIITPKKGTK